MATEIRENYPDGTIRLHRAVRFLNPTDRTIAYVGKNAIVRDTGIVLERWPNGHTRRAAASLLELRIGPKEIVEVPEDVANILVDLFCVQCDRPWRFAQHGRARNPDSICIEPSHPRRIRGGLAPQLQVVDDADRVMPVQLAGNLEPEPPPAYDLQDLHARVMSRIGGAK